MSDSWDPMDCSPSGSSVHEIFQARMLECVDISFARGYSGLRNRTPVSCIAGGFLHCRQIPALQADSLPTELPLSCGRSPIPTPFTESHLFLTFAPFAFLSFVSITHTHSSSLLNHLKASYVIVLNLQCHFLKIRISLYNYKIQEM